MSESSHEPVSLNSESDTNSNSDSDSSETSFFEESDIQKAAQEQPLSPQEIYKEALQIIINTSNNIKKSDLVIKTLPDYKQKLQKTNFYQQAQVLIPDIIDQSKESLVTCQEIYKIQKDYIVSTKIVREDLPNCYRICVEKSIKVCKNCENYILKYFYVIFQKFSDKFPEKAEIISEKYSKFHNFIRPYHPKYLDLSSANLKKNFNDKVNLCKGGVNFTRLIASKKFLLSILSILILYLIININIIYICSKTTNKCNLSITFGDREEAQKNLRITSNSYASELEEKLMIQRILKQHKDREKLQKEVAENLRLALANGGIILDNNIRDVKVDYEYDEEESNDLIYQHEDQEDYEGVAHEDFDGIGEYDHGDNFYHLMGDEEEKELEGPKEAIEQRDSPNDQESPTKSNANLNQHKSAFLELENQKKIAEQREIKAKIEAEKLQKIVRQETQAIDRQQHMDILANLGFKLNDKGELVAEDKPKREETLDYAQKVQKKGQDHGSPDHVNVPPPVKAREAFEHLVAEKRKEPIHHQNIVHKKNDAFELRQTELKNQKILSPIDPTQKKKIIFNKIPRSGAGTIKWILEKLTKLDNGDNSRWHFVEDKNPNLKSGDDGKGFVEMFTNEVKEETVYMRTIKYVNFTKHGTEYWAVFWIEIGIPK